MSRLLEKYANLLIHYCVSLQPNQRLLIETSTLAEPLVREIYREALRAGGLPYVKLNFRDQGDLFNREAHTDEQIRFVDPVYAMAMRDFEAYIHIKAPFYSKGVQLVRETRSSEQQLSYEAKIRAMSEALRPSRELYFQRTATLDMKRNLCEYPTLANAQNAGLSLETYEDFVYNACYLFDENPIACWQQVSRDQQAATDLLNSRTKFRYKSATNDITFTTEGRKWINSDGKTNMPSGEIYTSPVEQSVNGIVHFDYPSVYAGEEVEGITLWVKDGYVEKWEAKKGQKLLDGIFQIEGSRYFGEAAIGTNRRIPHAIKNILFDEKIGGTIHMAVGQSYLQTGGKNQSAIHWDMISDMSKDGEIYADDEKIYEKGRFLFV